MDFGPNIKKNIGNRQVNHLNVPEKRKSIERLCFQLSAIQHSNKQLARLDI